jgi:hypothetical protein
MRNPLGQEEHKTVEMLLIQESKELAKRNKTLHQIEQLLMILSASNGKKNPARKFHTDFMAGCD